MENLSSARFQVFRAAVSFLLTAVLLIVILDQLGLLDVVELTFMLAISVLVGYLGGRAKPASQQ